MEEVKMGKMKVAIVGHGGIGSLCAKELLESKAKEMILVSEAYDDAATSMDELCLTLNEFRDVSILNENTLKHKHNPRFDSGSMFHK